VHIGLWKVRESGAITRVFLDELIDVDPAAGAAGVKHDAIEHPAGVDRGGGFAHRLERLRWPVRLRGGMHDSGHRVESLLYRVEFFRFPVQHLGHLGVSLQAGLRRDLRLRVGDLREEVGRVGRVVPVPVPVEAGDVAVGPVVGRLRHEARRQKPHGQSEEQARSGHCLHEREK